MATLRLGGIVDDIREAYSATTLDGYDPKIIRRVVNIRKQPIEQRQEETELLAAYCQALNMQLSLPF